MKLVSTSLFGVLSLCTTLAFAQEEPRFSEWGYRHPELHARGIIDQINKATNNGCCSGIYVGECRVSEVDIPAKLAMVDRTWVPFTPSTKIIPIMGLNMVKDGNHSVAVVCASRLNKERASVYCIGVEPGI